MTLARERVVEALRQPTQQLMSMARASVKVCAVLANMRWQLIRFDEPVLAYSDQPVTVWPLGVEKFDTPPDKPNFGPLQALDVRVPLSSRLAVLVTITPRSAS